ncbi:hypothetical protein GCM10022631_20780 [Deinococcus rubellus]|uniref:Uncharacterized protein n=1 Tax=Deinococcus rubellus TaxID=1889240 RepID=A0ABY5YHC8_9DEIO|nr:hypothetical protein [Deinococcus rubellus]UWX64500.1 hypothetical protein N0D28_02180 [Deinococcus rubellus]
MQESKLKKLQAIHSSLLALSKELDEVRQLVTATPDTRKAVEGQPVIPHYTAIHREDLGQGRSRSYTVSYQVNPNGEMQIIGVSVTDADAA